MWLQLQLTPSKPLTAPCPRQELLTAEIGLDEHQQTEVRALLVRQGAAIRRVWTDKSLTDGERGPITGAIGSSFSASESPSRSTR